MASPKSVDRCILSIHRCIRLPGDPSEKTASIKNLLPERERIEKYGSPLVFITSLLGECMAVFCGPKNKLVASWWPNTIRTLFGKCLNTSRGEEAKWLRKMRLAYLCPDALSNRYTVTMEKVTRRQIQNHWQGKSEVKVFDKMKSNLFELACLLFLSLDDPKQVSELGILFNTFLKGLAELPINVPGTRFYRAKREANAIKKQLVAIIKKRRDALKQENASSSFEVLLSHPMADLVKGGPPFFRSVVLFYPFFRSVVLFYPDFVRKNFKIRHWSHLLVSSDENQYCKSR